MKPTLYALAGALAAVLIITTSAIAGSGVGGVFNLGQTNTVDAQTLLSGNPGGNPQLKVVAAGTAAAVRGDAASGIGVNGIHSASTGIGSGVEGRSASTDANSAGVLGRNTGGGPGLRAIVNAGVAPLAVNSQVKVANLNADKLDDLDSTQLQRRVSGVCASGQAVRVINVDGSVSCEAVGLSGAWSLNGNGGTTAANFLGTTGSKPLVLKTNNAERMRVTEGGNVGIGTTTPTAKLDVDGQTGTGVSGSGDEFGVQGTSNSIGVGVNGSSVYGVGVRGIHTFSNWEDAGVEGVTESTAGNARGVYGLVESSFSGDYSAGVRGTNNGTTANHIGVFGEAGGLGWGVYGSAPSGTGIRGYSPSGTAVVGDTISGNAGLFIGNVLIQGTLSKTAGSFKIDHPLHPASQYLQHSFVESPDMKNVYDGVVVTDRRGFATVTMPRWFQALNGTFRYQLTIVGRSFSQAIVWRELAHNRFTIRTSAPRVKVSWQVTGIRHDPYANDHRIQVEVPKTPIEQGKYIYPQGYGKSKRQSIGYQRPTPLVQKR